MRKSLIFTIVSAAMLLSFPSGVFSQEFKDRRFKELMGPVKSCKVYYDGKLSGENKYTKDGKFIFRRSELEYDEKGWPVALYDTDSGDLLSALLYDIPLSNSRSLLATYSYDSSHLNEVDYDVYSRDTTYIERYINGDVRSVRKGGDIWKREYKKWDGKGNWIEAVEIQYSDGVCVGETKLTREIEYWEFTDEYSELTIEDMISRPFGTMPEIPGYKNIWDYDYYEIKDFILKWKDWKKPDILTNYFSNSYDPDLPGNHAFNHTYRGIYPAWIEIDPVESDISKVKRWIYRFEFDKLEYNPNNWRYKKREYIRTQKEVIEFAEQLRLDLSLNAEPKVRMSKSTNSGAFINQKDSKCIYLMTGFSSERNTKYILEVSKDNGIAKRKYWTVYLVMSRQD
ncbi:MAG: hypothetical protein PUA96_04110 [Bacteroidales bacterium]|nr:hypothetical protein [Bacteroidales bacterium]